MKTYQKKNKKKKYTHRDCEWIHRDEDGWYCCDIRGKMFGKCLTEKDLDKRCCEFFHKRRTNE